jgi:2-keto-4-pentenoate hydratase/2-oxohepta-3-ene-1,7-dioic acid hydratase in catechol pathway
MKIATFRSDGRDVLGFVDGDAILDLAAAQKGPGGANLPTTMVDLIAKAPASLDGLRSLAAKTPKNDAASWRPLASTQLLAPIPHPTKNVFCVGRNYKAHIEEGARARNLEVVFPQAPEFFSKPPTSVIGHRGTIRLDPKVTQQFDYEVELGIVIGRTCRDVPAAQAQDVIFGYTIVNDVTARDLQRIHGIPFKGKALDTTCPIGPWIVTADEFGDPAKRRIALRVNGKTRQDSQISDLLFDCPAIIESLSRGMTLEPGDIIATGTPSGVAMGMKPPQWLKDGDVIEAEVEGIGVLENTVRQV